MQPTCVLGLIDMQWKENPEIFNKNVPLNSLLLDGRPQTFLHGSHNLLRVRPGAKRGDCPILRALIFTNLLQLTYSINKK